MRVDLITMRKRSCVELHDPSGQAPIAIASREISIDDDDDGTAGTVALFLPAPQ